MWMAESQGRRNDRVLVVVLLGLVALAWYVLLVWSYSPYARYLGHAALAGLPPVWSGRHLLLLSVFIGGWTLMTVAMMLPTSLPLIALFHRVVRRRPYHRQLIALLIVGYLGVWLAFGGAAYLADWALHQAVERSLWLLSRPWLISAAIFFLAGLYQYTPWKYQCLDQCRSPLTFIVEHWHGRHDRRSAVALGIRHGLFCLGCCWSLMVLMFAVGMGNLGWMLVLSVVMAAEKNLPGGRRLGKPLGALLLGWAVYILVLHPSLP